MWLPTASNNRPLTRGMTEVASAAAFVQLIVLFCQGAVHEPGDRAAHRGGADEVVVPARAERSMGSLDQIGR